MHGDQLCAMETVANIVRGVRVCRNNGRIAPTTLHVHAFLSSCFNYNQQKKNLKGSELVAAEKSSAFVWLFVLENLLVGVPLEW